MIKTFTKFLFATVLFISVFTSHSVFSQCANVSWTFSPAPINNEYTPGEVISVCIHVSYYQQTGANWLHGVIPEFPAGWDMSTLTVTSLPASCSGNGGGDWDWYNSCTGTGSGQSFGPGFYYDTNSGGPYDNNPGNNYGDPCTNFPASFSFCFTIQTAADCGGPSNPFDGYMLQPSVRITGDGISGSWNAPGASCANTLHPATNANSNINIADVTLNCCDAVAGVPPSDPVQICETGSFDLFDLLQPDTAYYFDGTTWVTEILFPETQGYWTYEGFGIYTDSTWVDVTDPLGLGTFDPTVDPPGDYTYHVTDYIYEIVGTDSILIDSCESTSTISLYYQDYGIVKNVADCSNTPSDLDSMYNATPAGNVLLPTGGDWYFDYGGPNSTLVSSGIIDPNNGSVPGVYTYVYYDSGMCKTFVSMQVIFASGGAAGCPNTVDVCTSDPGGFSPFNALGCNPTAGGNWIVYDSLGGFLDYMPVYSEVLDMDSLATLYNYYGNLVFQYVLGAPPCSPAFVDVTVNVHFPVNAGTYTTTSICVNDAPVDLTTLLEGNPDPGLTWVNLDNNQEILNMLDPSAFPPNTSLNLEYSGGLANTTCFSSALLELTILPDYAYAGEDHTITVCENDPPFLMTDSVPGNTNPPQTGGDWANPGGGVTGGYFTPGISTPGQYHYTVTSTCASDDSYLTINVLPTPQPGISGTLDICDNATNIALTDGLSGTVGTGGTWYLNNVPVGGTVNGNTVTDGAVYTYVVGTAPCMDSSTVTINVLNAPDAGVLTTAAQTYCDSDAMISLMSLFTTPPSNSNPNYWDGPLGAGGTVNPALGSIATGTYTYTIPDAGCGSASTSIDITIEDTPNAGTDATVSVCPNSTSTLDLLQSLGNPAGGGTWINVPAGGPTNGIFNPAAGHPAGSYTYELASPSGNCTDQATVTVQYVNLPFAGNDTTVTVCASSLAFNMLSVMSPGATAGTWTPATASAGIFNPAVDAPGTYTNSITVGSCAPVTAALTINVTPMGNAGSSASTSFCSTDGNVDLTSYLNGTPDPNGFWTDNNGNDSLPATLNISGMCGSTYVYTYTAGAAGCTSSSTLTFDVACPPNAGGDGTVEMCADAPAFNLYDGLAGAYDTPGSWSGPSGALTDAQAQSMDPFAITSGSVFTYSVDNSPCSADQAQVTVNIIPAMAAANVDASCTPSQTTYILTFDITGGQAPYSFVNGNAGTITGSTFTSNPIPAGTNYSVEISDAGSCGNLIVSGAAPSCSCPVNATFTTTNQTICIGSSVDLVVALNGGAAGNTYTVGYDDGSGMIPDVANLNNGDILATVSPTTTTTYTLTSVTDGNCFGTVTGSVTITVENLPDAGGDHTATFCGDGTSLNLSTLVSGNGEPTGGTFTPSSITANSANAGTYPYVMSGNVCPNDTAFYTINFDTPLSVTALQANCSAAQTDYTVTFTISGGTGPGTYTVDGQPISGSTYTSNSITLPDPGGYSFTVDDGGPCGSVDVSGSAPDCNCPVSASFNTGNQTICTGSSVDLELGLTGGTPGSYQISYSANGTDQDTTTGLSDGDVITVSPTVTTTYTLTSVTDGLCTGNTSGSVTITVEDLPNAGGDHTDTFCGDGSSLNLTTLVTTHGEPTGGSFTPGSINLEPASAGTYTYTMVGNVCPDDVAQYTVNITPDLVLGNVTATCASNQLEYTVNLNWSGGTPPYTVTNNTSGAVSSGITGTTFSETLVFATNGTYNYTISDSGPCDDIVISDTAPDCNCIASGFITGSTDICFGNCATITFHLTGDAPFNVTYQSGNSNTPTTLTNIQDGHQITVCPTADNTYTLLDVSDSYCQGTVSGSPVQVGVDIPFTITNVTQICNNTAETYQVQFNITGGTPPYTFTGATNTSGNPNVFTSAPIPSGSGYNITVSDAGVCEDQTVSSTGYTCACLSDAGSLPATPVEVCFGESHTFTVSGQNLDGNDVLQYILHSGGPSTIGAILATSSDGTFTFNYSGLQPGTQYYVHAVVGNNLGNGSVDMNGVCTDLSNGVAVNVNALPTASVSGGATVCPGETVDLIVNFTGEGPWDFTYAIDGEIQNSPNYSASDVFTLSGTQPGIYTIETVSDNNCSGTVSGQATIGNYETPTASISGNPEVCEGSGDGPQVSFTGNGPWTFVYTIDGEAQEPITTSSPQYSISAETSGTYALQSLEGGYCTGTVSGSLDVTILDAPTATITGGGTVCAGDSAVFNVELTGQAPWTVQYTVDGIPQNPLTNLIGDYTFQSAIDGDYVIVNVSDANCSGEVLASQASLNVKPIPTADLASSTNSVCIGQEVDITIDLEGTPPYNMTYVMNGDTITVSGLYGDFMQTYQPQNPLSMQVLYVEDGSDPTCSSEPNQSLYVSTSVLANAPVLSNDTICRANGPMQIGVSPVPGLTYTWSPSDNLSDPSVANPVYTPVSPGNSAKTFRYILTASNGECEARDTTFITVDPGPKAKFTFSPDPVKDVDPTVYFKNTSIARPGTMYYWVFDSLGTSTALNPSFKFPDEVNSKYVVELTAIDTVTGCIDDHREIIQIQPQMLVFVPSAFTPDGDGLNDLWGPVMTNVDPKNYKLTVYNRWGQIVFTTNDINKKWNGSNMDDSYFVEAGVYIWMIETKNEISLEEVTFKGQVTVVR